MANTGGIAALMKALNETPSLGNGLKASAIARPAAAARAASTSSASGVSSLSSAARTLRATSVSGTATAKPKILQPDGQGLDPKAPRGTYLNIVI